MAGYLVHWFAAPTQVLGEELFGEGVEVQAVFRAGEAVAFVQIEYIAYRFAIFVHGGHDLLTLLLFDARIIGALPDEQGGLNALGISERRA